MSSDSSLAFPYVRSTFLNGVIGSPWLCNGVLAFPNIYLSFPDQTPGAVRQGGHGKKQHHSHYSRRCNKKQFDTSHAKQTSFY
jgi:hypothetical protein